MSGAVGAAAEDTKLEKNSNCAAYKKHFWANL